MRKSSGGDRAWFLEEERELRNKVDFLAGEIHRAEASIYPAIQYSGAINSLQIKV